MKLKFIILSIIACLIAFSCEKVSNENYLDYSYSIPDNNFRLFLEEEGLIEVNSSTKEITLTQAGNDLVSLISSDNEIRNIDGIHIFPKLKYITFSENLIEKLPRNLGNIENLKFINNPFKTIIFEANDKIDDILFSHCSFLQKLDVSQLNNLKYLGCDNNYVLKELAIPNSITDLNIHYNLSLSSLDLANCHNLRDLYASGNKFNSVHLPISSSLSGVSLYSNQIEKIYNFQNQTGLVKLEIHDNHIVELDLSGSFASYKTENYTLTCGKQYDKKGNPIKLNLTLSDECKNHWNNTLSLMENNQNVVLK